MPRRIPGIDYRRKIFSSPRSRRYEPSLVSKAEFRHIVSIRNAEIFDIEILREVKQINTLSESQGEIARETDQTIIIDGVEHTIAGDHQLIENTFSHEYGWYGVVCHQLTATFRFDYSVYISPQHQLRLRIFDEDMMADKIEYCIPDFCVIRSAMKRDPTGLLVKSTRIMLLVESKSAGVDRKHYDGNKRDAVAQIKRQAGIFFLMYKERRHVGAMITVGRRWSFELLTEDNAEFPKGSQHNYVPSSDSSEEGVLFSDDYRFGTVESDNKLFSIRKKLLKLYK